MFEKIKKWYSPGLWSEAMVRNAVTKKVLTDKQAQQILYI